MDLFTVLHGCQCEDLLPSTKAPIFLHRVKRYVIVRSTYPHGTHTVLYSKEMTWHNYNEPYPPIPSKYRAVLTKVEVNLIIFHSGAKDPN